MYHRFYLLFCSLLSTFAFAGHEYDFSMLNVTEQLEQPAFREGKDYFSLIMTVEYAHLHKIY